LSNWKNLNKSLTAGEEESELFMEILSLIKTLGLSKLLFSALQFCPFLKLIAQEVNKLTLKFLWDTKPAKIKKSTVTA